MGSFGAGENWLKSKRPHLRLSLCRRKGWGCKELALHSVEIRGLAGAEGGGVFWGAAGGSPPCPGVLGTA